MQIISGFEKPLCRKAYYRVFQGKWFLSLQQGRRIVSGVMAAYLLLTNDFEMEHPVFHPKAIFLQFEFFQLKCP